MRAAIARSLNHGRKYLPAFLVPLIVAVRWRIARRRPAAWAEAQRQMWFVLGEDQPQEVVDRVAAGYLRRSIWRGESRWHPELVNHQEVVGVEALHDALRAGRGLIINFVHHGDYEGISPSLAAAGIPNHNVATSEVFSPGAPIWMQQQVEVVTSHEAVTLFDVAGGSAGIKELLAEGRAVAIATDQPGHTPMRFIGHDMSLSSGAARIAKDTNVPVAVVTSHPDPARPDGCGRFKVAEMLDPGDFDTIEDLLGAMVSRQEEAFLAWPEAAEHPLRMLNRELVKPPSKHRPQEAGDPESSPGTQAG